MPKVGAGSIVRALTTWKALKKKDGKPDGWVNITKGDVGKVVEVCSRTFRKKIFMVSFSGGVVEVQGHHIAYADRNGAPISRLAMRTADPELFERDDSDRENVEY